MRCKVGTQDRLKKFLYSTENVKHNPELVERLASDREEYEAFRLRQRELLGAFLRGLAKFPIIHNRRKLTPEGFEHIRRKHYNGLSQEYRELRKSFDIWARVWNVQKTREGDAFHPARWQHLLKAHVEDIDKEHFRSFQAFRYRLRRLRLKEQRLLDLEEAQTVPEEHPVFERAETEAEKKVLFENETIEQALRWGSAKQVVDALFDEPTMETLQ